MKNFLSLDFSKGFVYIGILSVMIYLFMYIIDVRTHLVSRVVNEAFFDITADYIACEQLPKIEIVKTSIEEHANDIERIKSIAPNNIVVDWTYGWNGMCSDTADITISFVGHEQKRVIQAMVGKTFFGVPYNLQPVGTDMTPWETIQQMNRNLLTYFRERL